MAKKLVLVTAGFDFGQFKEAGQTSKSLLNGDECRELISR
jgi:hypothetical protein